MNCRSSAKKDFKRITPKNIIIDTHGGIEDILSIVIAHRLLALSGSTSKIIGITCVVGKKSMEEALLSALAANLLLGTRIPVFPGQSRSLLLRESYPKTHTSIQYFELQAFLFSKVKEDSELVKLVQTQKAVDFISRSCNEHKSDLGIVALGPLTNLGFSHKLHGSLGLAGIISLTGGQYMGMGNTVEGHVEPNFAFDPLAAQIVFLGSATNFRDKIFINVIEKMLDFNCRNLIESCLQVELDDNMRTVLACFVNTTSEFVTLGPVLTILPLILPDVVLSCFHVYGEIVRDGGALNGLLAINWLKVGAQQNEYVSYFSIYEDFNLQKINELTKQALIQKTTPS